MTTPVHLHYAEIKKTITVPNGVQMFDIPRQPAYQEFIHELESAHQISPTEIVRPPKILPEVKQRFTVKQCQAFGSINVIISPFENYLGQLHMRAAATHDVSSRNLNEEYYENELVPAMEDLAMQEKRREDDIVNRAIEQGKQIRPEEFRALQNKVDEYQKKVDEYQDKLDEMNQTICKQQEEIHDLKKNHDHILKTIGDLNNQYQNLQKELMAQRNIHRLANYISLFREKIMVEVATRKNQSFSNDLDFFKNCVMNLGLSEKSWDNLQQLAYDLNEEKHGKLKKGDGAKLIECIAGTSYDHYVENFQELIDLFENKGWTE